MTLYCCFQWSNNSRFRREWRARGACIQHLDDLSSIFFIYLLDVALRGELTQISFCYAIYLYYAESRSQD